MKTNRLSLALACVALAAVTAHADTTLYFDDFTDVNNPDIATTNLHGTTPDTTIGTNTWIANTVWKADGTTASVNSTGADNSAFLAFTPTTGKVYTLSATLDVPTGGFHPVCGQPSDSPPVPPPRAISMQTPIILHLGYCIVKAVV